MYLQVKITIYNSFIGITKLRKPLVNAYGSKDCFSHTLKAATIYLLDLYFLTAVSTQEILCETITLTLIFETWKDLSLGFAGIKSVNNNLKN